MTDERLVKLIEDVLGLVTGKRVATKTAQRLADEIIGDGYIHADGLIFVVKGRDEALNQLSSMTHCVHVLEKRIEALEAEKQEVVLYWGDRATKAEEENKRLRQLVQWPTKRPEDKG